jgi:hypothetical protein
MTIITPTGITGINSITSSGSTLVFQSASGTSPVVTGLDNISSAGVITATRFVGNLTGNINSTGVSTIATLNVTQSNPTNLNVSGISTFAAGSASAPSISPTGDSNTGIFFPAADTIAFAEGGIESGRFDSSGRLGVGTANPQTRLDVSGDIKSTSKFFIGESGDNANEFGISAINTFDTAATSVNTVVESNENRSGVYWLNFNGVKFRAYVKANWLQNRNWVLATKFFDYQDMPSGSSLWINDTYVNEGDFNLYSGIFSKYKAWRYFSFNRLAMQMGNRIPPIMQFSSNQTLFGAFSGGRAGNGGGVTASSTDPQIANNATYWNMGMYMGPAFPDQGGSEDIMQSYGLNKWAGSSSNSTTANNQGSRSATGGTLQGFELTIEDSHPNTNNMDSVGFAGAWIGCPMDEGNFNFGGNTSNSGSDSGFGFGMGCGNNARTSTSGIAEWGLTNRVANYLPAYIWLSID